MTVPELTEDAPVLDLYPTYRVGDRVRVRLSGECVHQRRGESLDNRVILHAGHLPEEDGLEGVVVVCPDIKEWGRCIFQDHPLVVRYLVPIDTTASGIATSGAHYHAAELEPVGFDPWNREDRL